MLLSCKKVIGLPVKTKSGQYLGRVIDFEIDSLSQTIEKYFVKCRGLIGGLFEEKLIIHKNQVISINDEVIVVDETVIKDALKIKKTRLAAVNWKESGVIEASGNNNK